MINFNALTPMFDEEVCEGLAAGDRDWFDAVMMGNSPSAQEVARTYKRLLQLHAILHLRGQSHGDPQHDQCLGWIDEWNAKMEQVMAGFWN